MESLKLVFACAGIFFSFSYFAVLQEDVYKKDYGEGDATERFKYTFLALTVERGVNAVMALLAMITLGGSGLKIPVADLFNSGLSQMFAMAASNEALRFVSFPTQVLGKSCKMVPVMVGGIVLGGKKYKMVQYLQVLLITVGVCVFNFGGKKKSAGADSSYGLILIVISLVMDAVTGGLQDKVKARTIEFNPDKPKAKPTMHESMMWTNLSGCLVSAALAFATGHLNDGLAFCARHPGVLNAILIYSVSSAVGQNFIYYTITQFSPLLLTTVTTTRKIFSTVYSVLRNPANSLSETQWTGCALVFVGLIVEIAEKFLVPKVDKKGATPEGQPLRQKEASPSPAAKPKRVKKAE